MNENNKLTKKQLEKEWNKWKAGERTDHIGLDVAYDMVGRKKVRVKDMTLYLATDF